MSGDLHGDQDDVDAGTLANTATVSGTPPVGDDVTDEDAEDVPFTAAAAVLIVKSSDVEAGESVVAGDVVIYSFAVSNPGNVTLTDVTVTDPLVGLSAIDCDGSGTPTIDELPPGGPLLCTATYTVTQGDVDGGGPIVNTATVSGTPPTGDPVSDDDNESVQVDTTASVSLTKSSDATADLEVGGTINYTFSVTNTGTVTLSNVGVSDPLVGLSAITCDDNTNPIVSMAPAATVVCRATYTVTQDDVDAGTLANTATVSGTPPVGDDVTDEDAEDVPFTAAAAVLIVKSSDVEAGESVVAGDVVIYSFAVSNPGNVTLTDVTVTDPLVGLSAIDCDGSGTPTIDELPPGGPLLCTATYTVTQGDVDGGGPIVNTATVSGTPPTGDPVSDDDNESVQVDTTASVSLTKSSDATADLEVGGTINYTFSVTNTGTVTLSNVGVSDPLVGLSAITCDDNTNPIVSMAPAATVVCRATYTVTQDDVDAGTLANTATVSGTPPVGDDVTDEDAEDVPFTAAAAVLIVKSSDVEAGESVVAGDVVIYSFAVSNPGNVTLTDVTVTDPLVGLSAIDCDGSGTPTIDELPPGGPLLCTATYTVTQGDVDGGGPIVNTATVSGTPPTGDPVSDDDNESVQVDTTASVSLTKSSDATADLEVGGTINYTFSVTNTGTVTLSNVGVSDPLVGLSAITCDDNTNPIVSMAPAATVVCRATYTVTQDDVDAGTLANTATVSGTPPVGDDVTDEDAEDVPFTAAAAVLIVKSSDVEAGESVVAGDVVIYSFDGVPTPGQCHPHRRHGHRSAGRVVGDRL